MTDTSGTILSTVDVDAWGGQTTRSAAVAFQPHRFTTYERDADNGDEAQQRRYSGYWGRFFQPDPYQGSYDLSDPQSFNRYSYVSNDPVNFTDASGLISQGACLGGYDPVTGACRGAGGGVPGWWTSWEARNGGYPGFIGWGGERPIRERPESPEPQQTAPTPQIPEYCLREFRDAMERAWAKTGNGTEGTEAGFAGIRKSDGKGGSYPAIRDLPFTNERRNEQGRENLSFTWSAVYQSIWHVHPRGGPPSDVDQTLANDKKVPIYSFGRDGLYVYKPGDKAPVKLRNNLDWTKSCDSKPPLQ